MEANPFGLTLSSGPEQVGREKDRAGRREWKGVFPKATAPQESNKVLFSISFGGMV